MNINTTLEEFREMCPDILKEYLISMLVTPQSQKWHPEGPNEKVPHNVYFHTNIVYERAREYGDINLMMAAALHDMGKVDTTAINDNGDWGAHSHEKISAKLVTRYRSWIEELGCDYELVYNVVKEHMRIKKIGEMTISKKQKLLNNPYIDEIRIFTTFDNMQTI